MVKCKLCGVHVPRLDRVLCLACHDYLLSRFESGDVDEQLLDCELALLRADARRRRRK